MPGAEVSQRTEGMVTEFDEGSSIIDGLVSGEMSRDQFIRRATLLGISTTAIGGMLAAAGKATAADLGAARSLAGSTVNLLVAAEGDEKGVRDKIGEIKKRFGIDVKMTALAVGPLIEKANQSFKAPTGTYDAVMVLGFTVAQMVGGGFFEPLNNYVAKAPAGYDFNDFPKGELNYVGYFDPAHGRFGGKTLYLDPRPARRVGDHVLPQGSAQGSRGQACRRPGASTSPPPRSCTATASRATA